MWLKRCLDYIYSYDVILNLSVYMIFVSVVVNGFLFDYFGIEK